MRWVYRRIGKSARRNQGIAAVYFAIVGLGLAALFALVLDSAHYYLTFNKLQAAADGAALAATDWLPGDTARSLQSAINVAASDTADGKSVTITSDDVVFGKYDWKNRMLVATTDPPTAAMVSAKRTDDAHGGLVNYIFTTWSPGTKGSSQNATATAVLYTPQPGLLLEHQGPGYALDMQGNNQNQITVTNGAIIINSTSSSSANIHGNLSADQLAYAGGVNIVSGSTVPPLVSLQNPVPDPLINVPAIDPADYGNLGAGGETEWLKNGSNPDDLPPGVWLDGLPQPGKGKGGKSTYTLRGGIYVLSGSWAPAVYNTAIDPSTGQPRGVLLYLRPPGPNPSIGGLTIRALDPNVDRIVWGASTYAHIAIYEERQTPAPSTPIALPTYTGTPTLDVTGVIYMPYVQISSKGNFASFGNEVILDSLILQGSGSLTIDSNTYYPIPTDRPQRILVK